MATSKRRARVAPVASGKRRAEAGRRGRGATRSPLVLIVLVAVTVAALAAILVVALSHSSTGVTATPTAAPTAVTGTGTGNAVPNYGPSPPMAGIGVLDQNTGLAQRAASAPKVGQPAPDFAWLTTTGPMRLSAMRGHPVLIEFFAPWCPQCKHDVPLLNGLALEQQNKGLQVLSISASPYGKDYETSGSEKPITISDIDWFRRTYGAGYPMIFDPGSRVFNLYGYGSSYPTFFLIDAKGIVRFSTSTFISDSQLQAQVQAVL